MRLIVSSVASTSKNLRDASHDVEERVEIEQVVRIEEHKSAARLLKLQLEEASPGSRSALVVARKTSYRCAGLKRRIMAQAMNTRLAAMTTLTANVKHAVSTSEFCCWL